MHYLTRYGVAMTNKIIQLSSFMTDLDEANFGRVLASSFPSLAFVDYSQEADTRDPKPRSTINQCKGLYFGVVDLSILSWADYCSMISLQPDDGQWIYPMVGRGMVNIVHSRLANYEENSLLNGSIRASYSKDDPDTDNFAKNLISIFKKGALRVQRVSKESGLEVGRLEPKMFAWPNAAERFNGAEGRFLTNHVSAYYIAKR